MLPFLDLDGGHTPQVTPPVIAPHHDACQCRRASHGGARGLAYPLGNAEFFWAPLTDFPPRTAYEGTVVVEGRPAPRWRFVQHRLPGERPHWTTVARGPLTDIVDANGEFTATLRRKHASFSESEWQAQLLEASPAFDVIAVSALVPEEERSGYMAACSAG